MIIVTGAAGFIGSCLAGKLNMEGFNKLILVDDFTVSAKEKNLESKNFLQKIERTNFPTWIEKHAADIDFVFHIGARTDTTEFDTAIFDTLNLNYSKRIWEICTQFQIPLVYASSAATYGAGEKGYDDKHDIIPELNPLNPYGESKNNFDKWVLTRESAPPFWAGLKFFNVYGPNEYHKGRMASVIWHACRQIKETGSVRLFKSHRPDYADGMQKRDFIYVKDVTDVCLFLMQQNIPCGIFNLGTGQARTFVDLATATFNAMGLPPEIHFIDTPEDIRDTYQYFTEAPMQKLIRAGYAKAFTSLDDAIADYVRNYLNNSKNICYY